MPGDAALRPRFSLPAVGMVLAGYLILVAGLRLSQGSAAGESVSLLTCLGSLCAARRLQVRTRGVHDLPQFLGCLALMAGAYAIFFSLRSAASLPTDGLTLAYPLIFSYLDQYLSERTLGRVATTAVTSRAAAPGL